jgi:nitronate monooxygenase
LPVAPVLPASNRQSFGVECANLIHALKPEIVSFHFGLPEYELFQYVRSSGCNIISTATTLVEAQWLEKQGVSAIIAQGLEAGGHRGHFLSNDLSVQSNTLSLVETLVRHVSVPVIAAGGAYSAEPDQSCRLNVIT